MEFSIYRDLASIAFVRCSSKAPGTDFYAEGAALSVRTAIEKCKSELEEIKFVQEWKSKSKHAKCFLGIAAHSSSDAAKENAYLEALERLGVAEILQAGRIEGIPLWHSKGVKIWTCRAWDAYLAFVIFEYQGKTFATQSVARSRTKAALKAWTESRKPFLFRTTPENYQRATVSNQVLYSRGLENLRFRISRKNFQNLLPALDIHSERRSSRYIAYVTNQKEAFQ